MFCMNALWFPMICFVTVYPPSRSDASECHCPPNPELAALRDPGKKNVFWKRLFLMGTPPRLDMKGSKINIFC